MLYLKRLLFLIFKFVYNILVFTLIFCSYPLVSLCMYVWYYVKTGTHNERKLENTYNYYINTVLSWPNKFEPSENF